MDELMNIFIRGKNNEKIEDAEFSVECDGQTIFSGEKLESIQGNAALLKKIFANKSYITEHFLKQIQEKDLLINTAKSASKKKNDHKIWTPDFHGSSYFGGVVGVVEDDIVFPLTDDVEDDMTNVEHIKAHIKLQIQSRFDESKPYFLATMLLRDKINLNDNTVPSNEDDLYDYMLLFWYKTLLQNAYIKGFYRTYRRFESNNDRLKGAIDISRHIKLNAGQNNGKIAYSYRENTVNNYLNHMIVLAYEHIKRKYPELVEQNFDNDLDMKKIIDGLKGEIGYNSIDSKSIISKNNKPIAHPYYTEYEELRLICIKILRDEGISIWDAEDEKTKSILFYVPDLWELYLEDMMKLHIKNIDLGAQDTIEIFGNIDDKSKYVKETYPDFVFYDNENDIRVPYLILDAKFRKGWESALIEGGKTDSKIYDLSDYDKCIRDMNSLGVNATGIIYPTNTPCKGEGEYYDEKSICHTISKYNDSDMFYTFPVFVPSANDYDNYSKWKSEFEINIKSAMEVIGKKIEKERAYAEKVREFKKQFPVRNS